ncbi:MAG: helix-turn-helix transcriptional regulator [Scytonema sp. PMC 1069.18]|nr:helix-turn-helix transcriptional regulator [Scytonema sp. PMC 1069.18]MEC4880368.1 helix-turn-helix transcriptional regulator [Scytonema sp. PMC 1070.18]
MIKNEHQLMVTKSWIEKFHQAITSLYQNEEEKQKDLEGWQGLIDSYYAQINNLQSEITEYEYLKNHNPENSLVLSTPNLGIDEIGEVLIKVRIAKKLTEKDLAEVTQLSEEQIKEYEQDDYHYANFETVIEVADALGIKLQHCVVVSEMNEFLDNHLMEVGQPENMDDEIDAAFNLIDCYR